MSAEEPIVLVHGLFGSFCEAPAIAALAPATVTAPDLHGYGSLRDDDVTLAGQVQALQNHIREHHTRPVHLVAHSIGAVYAFEAADVAPDLIASLTSVEGNFSLADAFWSRSIAAMDEETAEASISRRLKDPISFLAGDGINPTPAFLRLARDALAYQSWRAIWRSAQGIVNRITQPSYQDMLMRVFGSLPVHLIAGERSSGDWHIPKWAYTAAASISEIPGVGHMMMLEDPDALGQALCETLNP